MSMFLAEYPVNGGVSSLNGLTGALTLVGAGGITITPSGTTITITGTGGTVTSVGLTDGSTTPIFSISGSPVTTSGTLDFTLINQLPNTVFAGPASGGSAQPTFRSLVSADIPNLSAIYVTQSEVGSPNGVAPLDGAGKVPYANLPSAIMTYKGAWNPTTNTPTLTNGVGNNGDVYRASVGGTSTSPIADTWFAGDFIIYNGTIWQRSPLADGVISVNGASGIVTVNAINQLTGDATAGPATGSQSQALTLATVNANVGSFTNANITVNAKGLITAASNGTSNPGTVTNFVFTNGGGFTGTVTTPTSTPTLSLVGTLTGDVTGSLTATVLSATTNSTLTTLSSLALPTTQLTGTLQAAQEPAHTGDVTNTAGSLVLHLVATSNSTLTTLSALSLPYSQITGAPAAGITQLTGDVTAGPGSGSQVATLATVNANIGSFGSSTSIPSFTVNAKGLITAASGNAVVAPAGTLTGTTLASNVVSSSLTSVGTITSGTWNGTAVTVPFGGTGQTSLTAFNVLLGNGASAVAFAPPGAAGTILVSNGTAANPTFQSFSAALTAPTVQKFITGTAQTYTRPTSPTPLYIKVTMVGGGGGGGGSGSAGATNGTAGTASTFGTSLLSAGGGGAGLASQSAGGAGGTSSLGSGPIGISLTGTAGGGGGGGTAGIAGIPGGYGGSSALGGGGSGEGATAGTAGATNTGSGGAGAGSANIAGIGSSSGGGSGGYVSAIITSPATTYTYTVGTNGSAGGAGTSGFAGGAGAVGIILVEEFYQ